MIYAIVRTKDRVKFLEPCINSLQGSETIISLIALESKDTTQHTAQWLYQEKRVQNLILVICQPYFVDMIEIADLVGKLYQPKDTDYLLLTADDYVYKPGWQKSITDFLSASPDVAYASCELEPLFPWNIPREKVTRNGQTALIRDTIPCANWIFPYGNWMMLRRYITQFQRSPQLDHQLNALVRANNGKLAALNLAEHVGAYESSCGNRSFQEQAKPLPEEWRI